MDRHSDFEHLANAYGIVFPAMVRDYLPAGARSNFAAMAMDAQTVPVTQSNAGIPAYLTNYVDPDVVRILTTPTKGAEILGEQKKGDWTTQTASFPIVESTGETSAYGDWNNNGSTGVNINWEFRQSFLFQTIAQWGELELERAGLARINYATELNTSAAQVLSRFLNRSYFFGIAGLKNYGLLNDPSLPAPITPVGGGNWAGKDGAGVYTDIVALYGQLIAQTGGLIDRNTPMTLAMSPRAEVNMTKTNMYNVNVTDQIRKNFPNLKIVTAVEYSTQAGELVQLIVDSIDGQDTGYAAFNEKQHDHAVVVHLSGFQQKKSAGTWGAIIRMPLAFAQMLGV